jgi:hypothetical protein
MKSRDGVWVMRMVMFKAGALVVLVAAAASTPLDDPRLQAATQSSLSAQEIHRALAYGRSGEPAPYLLRHDGEDDNPSVVAAVYTPYLRIALASRAARLLGRRLDVAYAPVVSRP